MTAQSNCMDNHTPTNQPSILRCHVAQLNPRGGDIQTENVSSPLDFVFVSHWFDDCFLHKFIEAGS